MRRGRLIQLEKRIAKILASRPREVEVVFAGDDLLPPTNNVIRIVSSVPRTQEQGRNVMSDASVPDKRRCRDARSREFQEACTFP